MKTLRIVGVGLVVVFLLSCQAFAQDNSSILDVYPESDYLFISSDYPVLALNSSYNPLDRLLRKRLVMDDGYAELPLIGRAHRSSGVAPIPAIVVEPAATAINVESANNTYTYYPSGRVESVRLTTSDADGMIYYHYIDEDIPGLGHGAIDKAVRQSALNGELSYAYEYFYIYDWDPETDTMFLSRISLSKKTIYANADFTGILAEYTYYNDEFNTLCEAVLTHPDANGMVYYHYDENGRIERLKRQTANSKGEMSWTFAYHAGRDTISVTNVYSDSDFTVLLATYAYGEDGFLTSVTLTTPDNDGMIRYEYTNDADNRLVRSVRQTPLNGELSYRYVYNEFGELQEMYAYSDADSTEANLVAIYTYNLDGRYSKRVIATGITYTYYNGSNRLARIDLSAPDSNGITWYEYKDEGRPGQDHGRIDRSGATGGWPKVAYYVYYYHGDSDILERKEGYSDGGSSECIYTYYGDPTNYLFELSGDTNPGSVTNIKYYRRYLNESWNGQGYGRLDREWTTVRGEPINICAYTYYDDGRLRSIEFFSDIAFTDLIESIFYIYREDGSVIEVRSEGKATELKVALDSVKQEIADKMYIDSSLVSADGVHGGYLYGPVGFDGTYAKLFADINVRVDDYNIGIRYILYGQIEGANFYKTTLTSFVNTKTGVDIYQKVVDAYKNTINPENVKFSFWNIGGANGNILFYFEIDGYLVTVALDPASQEVIGVGDPDPNLAISKAREEAASKLGVSIESVFVKGVQSFESSEGFGYDVVLSVGDLSISVRYNLPYNSITLNSIENRLTGVDLYQNALEHLISSVNPGTYTFDSWTVLPEGKVIFNFLADGHMVAIGVDTDTGEIVPRYDDAGVDKPDPDVSLKKELSEASDKAMPIQQNAVSQQQAQSNNASASQQNGQPNIPDWLRKLIDEAIAKQNAVGMSKKQAEGGPGHKTARSLDVLTTQSSQDRLTRLTNK